MTADRRRHGWTGIAGWGLTTLLTICLLGGLGTESADARKSKKRPPDRLLLKAAVAPSGFTPEQIEAGFPAKGKGLRGRLVSRKAACRRNRPLTLHYRHWFSDGPVTQPFYADGGRVRTRKNGTWSTSALNLLFYWQPNVVRVSVSTEARGRCKKLKSPTIKVAAVVVPLPTG